MKMRLADARGKGRIGKEPEERARRSDGRRVVRNMLAASEQGQQKKTDNADETQGGHGTQELCPFSLPLPRPPGSTGERRIRRGTTD